MRKQNRNRAFTLETPETPMIRKIVATLLLRFNALPRFVNEHGFYRDSLAQLLGVAHLEEDVLEDRREVIEAVRAVCVQTLKEPADYPETLEANLARLRRIVDLKDLEADLLRFTILLHYSPELDDLFDLFEPLHTARAQMLLAGVLDADYRSIGRILSPRGTLARSGLLGVDRNFGGNSMRSKLDLLSSGFADMMMSYEGEDLYEIFKEAVRRVSAPSLNLEDFSHMAKERSLMLRYMQKAAATRKAGAHILIYGPPGTGKTEWVKTMAAAMDLRLFEISYADEDDEPLNGRNRINAFKSAQYLFGGKRVMLMFDEIEDIFEEANPVSSLFGQKPTPSRKGWFNRILENAPVPTVWISNSIAMMDEAMLRRFDLVVHMPVPPQSKRLQIAKEAFGKRVKEPALRAMAEHPAAAPAVLSRAAEVLALIDPDKKEADTYALTIVSATLEAQGYRPLKKATRIVTGAYDPKLVNCDADLATIADGIARNPSARLCLYGPPGAGKSAFGKWLAGKLDRPCLIKKGSDLLSMWVGGTEANIAAAFDEAERENAVLVFDEIDGFLQDRREAQRSWEVTQVNELLTQMEAFEGVFVATTNLMENLDPASLRRFDLKLRFGYLRPTQAAAMFASTCGQLSLNGEKEGLRIVKSLRTLTPGDFAAVVRQSRFRPLANALELAERLAEECAVKEESPSRTVGFSPKRR